jgi:enolase-phosphatase E1
VSSAVKIVLLDVEGTTTAIDFVHTTLFDVARRELADYLEANWESPEVDAARAAVARDKQLGVASVTPALLERELRTWIDQDRQETTLKVLQGKIWNAAYGRGELKSHVYDDVPRAFERWQEQGLSIAIFSSGSVEAQRVLFAHTRCGDLSAQLSGYFDTTTGPKREARSYARIAQQLNVPCAAVHFFSDVVAELDAAREAGFVTTQLLRPGVAPMPGSKHPAIRSFDELFAG